ncbi:hypothetical protein OF83DRAFT_338814 [Amylostereum chailletii]|nr:hypothetical protein OF83DRAFT_338814 [Amylostereum chailletii]
MTTLAHLAPIDLHKTKKPRSPSPSCHLASTHGFLSSFQHRLSSSHSFLTMSVINTTAHLPGGSLDRHPIMSSAPPMSQLIALQLENARLLDDLKIAFHRHFNKSQSISRLPPEILLEIFRILRLKWWYQSCPQSEASSTTEHIPFELGWIKVSHVCHRWREILIAHPSLWNTVDCTRASIPWIEEMLRRAHPTTDSQMPIEFTVNTTSPDDNVGHDGASMKILSVAVSLPYAAALQSLEITSWESDTMLELCKRTLPNLESLTPAG